MDGINIVLGIIALWFWLGFTGFLIWRIDALISNIKMNKHEWFQLFQIMTMSGIIGLTLSTFPIKDWK